MQPTIQFWVKKEFEAKIEELQREWDLKVRPRMDGDRMVATCHFDPLDPTIELPRVVPSALEKVTARIPVYENIPLGTYVDHRGSVLEVRAATRGENGAVINFRMLLIVGPDILNVALVYRDVLEGKIAPKASYPFEAITASKE